MKITTVTVRYGQTYSTGDYNNIRPEITLSAEIDEGDLVREVLRSLEAEVRKRVQAMIDLTLEQEDEPPHYYDGPRYNILTQNQDKLVTLVPLAVAKQLDNWYEVLACRRLEVAQGRFNNERYAHWQKFDCTDGDTSRLPHLADFSLYVDSQYESDIKTVVLMLSSDRHQLGKGWYRGYWPGYSARLRANIIAETQAKAAKAGATFIDATDGELTKIPEIKRPEPDPDAGGTEKIPF